MNILFLTIAKFNVDEKGIYRDLLLELKNRGHNIYVAAVNQRRTKKPTTLSVQQGITVLQIKTGNLTKCGLIEKGLSILFVENQFVKAIKRYFGNVHFDLVTYSTPPVTFFKTVQYVKKSSGALAYLQLKDIFPQNAADLSTMKQNGLIYRYFRNKEKKLYAASDFIGCMSPANCEFVIKHNPEIDPSRVELCPNAVKPSEMADKSDRSALRAQHGIPQDKVVYVYGGNLGRSQGIPYLIQCLRALKDDPNAFFLIIGSGTEYKKIALFLEQEKPKNVRLLESLAKSEYEALLSACDVGLIFLDQCFTIPNFPSRLLSYLENELPVITATDEATDIGDILEQATAGIKTIGGRLHDFIAAVNYLAEDAERRAQMGKNARRLLTEQYTPEQNCDIILSHLNK